MRCARISKHNIGLNINKQLIRHQYPTVDSHANNIQNQHNSHYGTGQNTHIQNENYKLLLSKATLGSDVVAV